MDFCIVLEYILNNQTNNKLKHIYLCIHMSIIIEIKNVDITD